MLHSRCSSAAAGGLPRIGASRRMTAVVAKAGQSSSNAGGGGGGSAKRRRTAQAPGLYEVECVTPPPKSLGIYMLPPTTHNGEEIEVNGHGFIVTSLIVQFKMQKGKYVRYHNRLQVQQTGRYFTNLQLEDCLMRAIRVGDTGLQD